MHFVHTSRAPQYLSDCVQTVALSSRRPGLRSSDSRLRQAEVQNQVRRARFLLCWTRCLEQSSAPPSPNQWHRSFKRQKLNYFAEHITASCVSAPGRFINSAL